jgi:hypothetical protein
MPFLPLLLFVTPVSAATVENQDLFGQFVGDWEVEVTFYRADGSRDGARGEWRFERILEGRAVQDVWRIWTPQADPVGYGTTIRFYDPKIDAWRVTWHGVLNGVVYKFLARRVGAEIVLEGQDLGEPSRWIFSDIEADSFRWRAVSSTDGGKTWVLDQEMIVRRKGKE